MADQPDGRDLAVVIPTRDRWDILGLTLQALRGQTVGRFETVVVVDGVDQVIPDLPGVTVVTIPKGGPGAARNEGVASTGADLLLFLGDDTIPDANLVERHLMRHRSEPDDRIAVLGDIEWHRDVAKERLHRWLDWSATQFDYRRLRHDLPADAGYGRFIASNTSLKRSLFERAGGFDERFIYFCEDLDLGYRLAQLGMVLRYDPGARARHLHRYDWGALERRFAAIAPGERMMAAKHANFRTHFQPLIEAAAVQPAVSPLWAHLVDRVPDNGGRARAYVEQRANRWYHQRLAPAYLRGWELDEDLEELRIFAALEPASSSGAVMEGLGSRARSGAWRHYRDQIGRLLGPQGRLLDYDSGTGSDGLRLLAAGHHVEFFSADPTVRRHIRWRLRRRGSNARVYDHEDQLPGGFAVAWSIGTMARASDPKTLLRSLEAQAEVVAVDLSDMGSATRWSAAALLAHARHRGIVRYRRHESSHFVAYRGDTGSVGRLSSHVALHIGRAASRWEGLRRLKLMLIRHRSQH